MPRALGAADSFNSSGATIVPEREKRSQRSYDNTVSSLSSANALMPQDSLGRELEASMIASQSCTQAQSPEWDVVHATIRNFAGAAYHPSEDPFSAHLPDTETADYTEYLNNPTPASDVFAQLNIAHPDQPSKSVPLPSQSSSASQPILSPISEHMRPLSATSHHSSISGSDFSYTTTEMDTDDAEARMELPHDTEGTMWDGLRPDYSIPLSLAGDPGPTTVSGAFGPIRRAAGQGEDESKRKERLEHRRSINRKSAQKHRARRKEELEQMGQVITQRDLKIAQLEQELAVERSKTHQLTTFIQMQMDANKDKPVKLTGAP